MFYEWRPYVPVAERRRQAAREMKQLKKKGHPVSPVVIEGRTIAQTFWGRAWCDNLEAYSDFSNRLPRGRTYVRNGSVVDLQVAPVPRARWSSICGDCAGAIDSLVELLQARFSKGVMERLCQQTTGLFPKPSELEFSCSCPDWASMCKHVAAVLYGIGARLDDKPELLFTLRRVDQKDLIAQASSGLPLSKTGPSAEKVLGAEGLSELFGLELDAARPADDSPGGASQAQRSRPGTARGDAAGPRRREGRRAKPAAPTASPRRKKQRGRKRRRGAA